MDTFFPESLQILNTIGLVVLGILFVIKTARSQSSSIDASTIASLQAQVKAVQGEVDIYKKQVLDLTQQMGKQDGIIQTQKETIEKYEKILQNRNPELLEVLKEIRDFMQDLRDHNDFMVSEMKHQTEILDKNEERHIKLDKTHGEIARSSTLPAS